MNENLCLRVLGDLMGWSDEEARREYRWLHLMARMKYDGYQDFVPGARFIENLVRWIQQFRLDSERQAAYNFVRGAVVYIGPAEMLRLVERLYPGEVQRTLLDMVATQMGIPPYMVWASSCSVSAYYRLLRRTLFIGLSDGARLDLFRRANEGVISNEQIVVAAHIDGEKWDDLLDNLKSAEGQDGGARFAVVYLIDDFVGTGTTFIRKDRDTGKWKGKLAKFYRAIGDDRWKTHLEPKVSVRVHHYIAANDAVDTLRRRQACALKELGSSGWFERVEFSYGTVLPSDLPIDSSGLAYASAFLPLTKQYYDAVLETKHTGLGGTDMRLGFSGCALPLVLEHNTPNNSVSLLWAETPGDGDGSHTMIPLFRRRQRHV